MLTGLSRLSRCPIRPQSLTHKACQLVTDAGLSSGMRAPVPTRTHHCADSLRCTLQYGKIAPKLSAGSQSAVNTRRWGCNVLGRTCGPMQKQARQLSSRHSTRCASSVVTEPSTTPKPVDSTATPAFHRRTTVKEIKVTPEASSCNCFRPAPFALSSTLATTGRSR